jgi:ribA/ribD-fused uncharacterized protein
MVPKISELETSTHVYFLRGVFSNFTSTPMMQYKGHSFQTTEQAFMWAKAQLFGDKDSARLILAEKNPAKAKELGRGVKGFNPTHWDINKEFLMYEVNLAKYSQFDDYKSVLLSTGEKRLVEVNGKDTIWGIGLYANDPRVLDEKQWRGQNLLGKVLMRVREELK